MALQKPNEVIIWDISLTNTYKRIKHQYSDKIVVKKEILDEEWNWTWEYEFRKVVKQHIVLVTYENEAQANTDAEPIKTEHIEYSEDFISTNTNCLLWKLYLRLKEDNNYSDCLDI